MRWESERGRRVYSRAGRNLSKRRRGEILLVAARRHDRSEIGAGESSVSEVVTAHSLHRSIYREEGSTNTVGWLVWTVLKCLIIGLVAGLGLMLGWLAYMAWWLVSPRVGPVRAVPYLVVAAVAVVASVVTWSMSPPDVLGEQVTALWWRGQFVLAPLYAAWLVRAWGWQAVKTEKDAKPEQKAATFTVDLFEGDETPDATESKTTSPETARTTEPETDASDDDLPVISVRAPDKEA